MKPSPALRARLQDAEAELERLQAAQAVDDAPGMDVEKLIPGLPAIFIKLVDRLETTLASGDITRLREEIRFDSEQNHAVSSLLRASGTHLSLVAGVCFVNFRTRLSLDSTAEPPASTAVGRARQCQSPTPTPTPDPLAPGHGTSSGDGFDRPYCVSPVASERGVKHRTGR